MCLVFYTCMNTCYVKWKHQISLISLFNIQIHKQTYKYINKNNIHIYKYINKNNIHIYKYINKNNIHIYKYINKNNIHIYKYINKNNIHVHIYTNKQTLTTSSFHIPFFLISFLSFLSISISFSSSSSSSSSFFSDDNLIHLDPHYSQLAVDMTRPEFDISVSPPFHISMHTYIIHT